MPHPHDGWSRAWWLRGLRSHPGWLALALVVAWSLYDGRIGTEVRGWLP
ncbi:MAG TPA: hypothetical protein VFD90_15320 [Gaiellales bacterium]|jgi:hypothetical protein|nr:hypothetical protein [Gaiellales bacterium]